MRTLMTADLAPVASPSTQARLLAAHDGRLVRTALPRKLDRFGGLLGSCAAMQHVYDLIARVAKTDATIMLAGDTGTGKEMVAQTIHELSRRYDGAFLPVNCGAMSPTLIESELFGHERGSFTGANHAHRGYFERANGGTLFLDEVTEMPFDLQVKLLRVLETGTLMRVGAQDPIRLDVRVIAATNCKPEEAVAKGKLRRDLLYRLNVFPIVLPPLREREDDLELLAEDALEQLNQQNGTNKRFTKRCLERLKRHSWPGNVRELRNAIQRAFILAEDMIDPANLAFESARPTDAGGETVVVEIGMSIAEVKRRLMRATVDACRGDKKKAATLLGIGLKTLYNWLSE
jgi:DNA-binding NtrC family response regulator